MTLHVQKKNAILINKFSKISLCPPPPPPVKNPGYAIEVADATSLVPRLHLYVNYKPRMAIFATKTKWKDKRAERILSKRKWSEFSLYLSLTSLPGE